MVLTVSVWSLQICCLFIIQGPYARKRQINQKPYKVENISKNIGLSEFSSEEVTELHGVINWGKDEVIIRLMKNSALSVCVFCSLFVRDEMYLTPFQGFKVKSFSSVLNFYLGFIWITVQCARMWECIQITGPFFNAKFQLFNLCMLFCVCFILF